LRQVADNEGRLREIKVGEVMTRDLIIAIPDDDAEAVLGIMTRHRMRHLPVLEQGRVAGIISIGDIVKAKLSDSAFEVHHLRDYIMGRY